MLILYTVLIVGFEVMADKIQLPNWKTIMHTWTGLPYFHDNINSSLLAFIPNTFKILYSTLILKTLAYVVKIPHGLWGLVLYYSAHKNSLLVHILNQTNTAHPHILHIHFNIILPSMIGFQKASSVQCFQLKFLHNYWEPGSSTCGISACPHHFETEKEYIQ